MKRISGFFWFLGLLATASFISGCISENWDCGGHSEPVEGDCACVDGYAYPNCEKTLAEVFGAEMVLDTVWESALPKAWSNLQVFYLTASHPRSVILREAGFEKDIFITIDENGSYFDSFVISPQANRYMDTLGQWNPTSLHGSLVYNTSARTFDITNFDPKWTVVYRVP